MSADLTRLPAADLAALLAAGEVSSVEATQAHLDRIAAVDGDVHAFLHINAAALDAAAAADAARSSGSAASPLAGVPVAIKDVLCTLDMPSTAASKILEGWIPPYDATVVARLRAAGMVERAALIPARLDAEIGRRAMADFEPAIPVTPTGAGFAGAGFVAGYGGFSAIAAGFAALWRRRGIRRGGGMKS